MDALGHIPSSGPKALVGGLIEVGLVEVGFVVVDLVAVGLVAVGLVAVGSVLVVWNCWDLWGLAFCLDPEASCCFEGNAQ